MDTTQMVIATLSIAVLAGCQTQPEKPKYWDLSTSQTVPTTATERQAECGRIRDEIARIHSIADAATTTLPPIDASTVRARARQKLSKMDQRAATVGCKQAFSER